MQNVQTIELYLEAHVTIAPVFGKHRDFVERVAKRYGFKLAHLVMLKEKGPDVISQRDTFMTGHGKNIDDLVNRTQDLVADLSLEGYKIWRYKIESCVIDSRQTGDVWNYLDPDRPQQPLIACDGCSVRS